MLPIPGTKILIRNEMQKNFISLQRKDSVNMTIFLNTTAQDSSRVLGFCLYFHSNVIVMFLTTNPRRMHLRGFRVVPPRIELGTQGFSVLCSTNWAMAPFPFWDCKGRNKILLCKFLDAYFLKKMIFVFMFWGYAKRLYLRVGIRYGIYTAATRIWGSNGV